MKLTFVVPCYNEEKNIKLFYNDVVKNFKNKGYDIELIFINDGSKDNTIGELKKLVKLNDFEIKIIDFSRNFGKEAGIYAGLKNSTGDYTVLIDADMQQPPRLVLDMLKCIKEDNTIDIVAYYQETRVEGNFLSFLKKRFYSIINKITKLNFVNGASDFRLIKRNVLNAILEFTEEERFSKGIFAWIGFNTKYLPYVPLDRANGKTSWSLRKLLSYAMSGILSFTNKPLKVVTHLGIFNIVVSFIWFIILILLNNSINNLQYILSFILFMSGLNFIVLGYIGEFISRTYNEARKRPIYIAREVLTNEKVK